MTNKKYHPTYTGEAGETATDESAAETVRLQKIRTLDRVDLNRVRALNAKRDDEDRRKIKAMVDGVWAELITGLDSLGDEDSATGDELVIEW